MRVFRIEIGCVAHGFAACSKTALDALFASFIPPRCPPV
jgi:hypothetical protein